jgi:hypothetical protein
LQQPFASSCPPFDYPVKRNALIDSWKHSSDPDGAKNKKNWFRLSAFFRKAEAEKGEMSDDELFSNKRDLSTYTRALLAIADAAEVETPKDVSNLS